MRFLSLEYAGLRAHSFIPFSRGLTVRQDQSRVEIIPEKPVVSWCDRRTDKESECDCPRNQLGLPNFYDRLQLFYSSQ